MTQTSATWSLGLLGCGGVAIFGAWGLRKLAAALSNKCRYVASAQRPANIASAHHQLPLTAVAAAAAAAAAIAVVASPTV